MKSVKSFLCLPAEDLDQVVDAVGSRWEGLLGQRLLLTGATGFIGKWLLATFLHANSRHGLGAKIVALSRNPERFVKAFPLLSEVDEIQWIKGDVRELAPEVAIECKYAIHAATDVIARSAPSEILDSCISGTRCVLEAMAAKTVPRRVLLLSSGAVYGRVPSHLVKIPETWTGGPDTLMPASAYGEGKRITELLGALAAAENPHLEVSIARCFAFVGPYLPLDKHFAIGNFIDAAINNRDIFINGDGTPLRTYLYAADLACWLWTIMFDGPTGHAYNVGGDEILSIADLAHRVNDTLGGKGNVRIAQEIKQGNIPDAYLPSLEKIRSQLHLKPSVSLDEAIIKTAKWVIKERQEGLRCK